MSGFDPNKEYKTKKRGYPFRFYADDGGAEYPIHGAYYHSIAGWQVECWTRDLYSVDHTLDLVEVTPYDDFEIDEPVMVRDRHTKWRRRYFAGVSSDNKPMAWASGATSWSAAPTTCVSNALVWNECRRPTEEELNND